VALVAVVGGNDGEEEASKLRNMVSFLFESGGVPEGKRMPRRTFGVVADLLMPSWEPLRKGAGQLQD